MKSPQTQTIEFPPNKVNATPTRRLHILDFLRGVAALMVCACHFSATLPNFIGDPLRTYGSYGIEIFFVISGFIIPYGMSRAGYNIRNYWEFMLKRLARLHPPYLVALIITLIVSYLAAKVTRNAIDQSPLDIISYLFYLKPPPTNPVFWTLRVEMEYYIFIGLAYGLFMTSNSWIRNVAFAVTLSSVFVHGTPFKILPFMAFFLMGILTLLRYQSKIGRYEYAAWLGICALAAYIAEWSSGSGVREGVGPMTVAQATAVGLATALIILTVQVKPRAITDFLGQISYSLYLIHFVIGVKFLNFLQGHFNGLVPRVGLFFMAFVISIACAYLLYLLIEKPSIAWSSAVKYKKFQKKDAATT